MSSFIGDSNFFDVRTNSVVICKCGCRIPFSHKDDVLLCRWCGNYVFKNKQVEFEHKLKEKIIKQKR